MGEYGRLVKGAIWSELEARYDGRIPAEWFAAEEATVWSAWSEAREARAWVRRCVARLRASRSYEWAVATERLAYEETLVRAAWVQYRMAVRLWAAGGGV